MKMNWIPVAERLPKYDGDYLCCLENKVIRILKYGSCLTLRHPQGFYSTRENGITCRQDMNPVIAWMPLPERIRKDIDNDIKGF